MSCVDCNTTTIQFFFCFSPVFFSQDSDSALPCHAPPPAMHPYHSFPPLGLTLAPGLGMGTSKAVIGGHPLLLPPGSQVSTRQQRPRQRGEEGEVQGGRGRENIVNDVLLSPPPQARVSLPSGLAMHSLPGRQVCIDGGLPPFFHMPPSAHAHSPAPTSPQLPPSPHFSHTHKVGARRRRAAHCRDAPRLGQIHRNFTKIMI